jgi:hypothetical protein
MAPARLRLTHLNRHVELHLASYMLLVDVNSMSLTCRALKRRWRGVLFSEFGRRFRERLALRSLVIPLEHCTVAGGFVLSTLLDEDWEKQDVDCVVRSRATLTDAVAALRNANSIEFDYTVTRPVLTDADVDPNNLIEYNEGLEVVKLGRFDGITAHKCIDVICPTDAHSVDKFAFLDTFDLSCCMCAYDGTTLVVRFPDLTFTRNSLRFWPDAPHGLDWRTILSEIDWAGQWYEIARNYDSLTRAHLRRIGRLRKYWFQRGFTVFAGAKMTE